MTKANSQQIAKTNASPAFAAQYYHGLIAKILADPAAAAVQPQLATLTKLDQPNPA